MKANQNLVTMVDVSPRSFLGVKVTSLTPENAVKIWPMKKSAVFKFRYLSVAV